MSREELSAFLLNAQLSLDVISRKLETSLSAIQDAPRDTLPDIFDTHRAVFEAWCLEQRREWEAFAAANYSVEASGARGLRPLVN